MNFNHLANTQTSSDEILKAMLNLLGEMAERESRMNVALQQGILRIRDESEQARLALDNIVRSAGDQIATSAEKASRSATAKYEYAVAEAVGQLRSANKMVWTWLGGAIAILAVTLLSGWLIVDRHKNELASIKQEYEHYENATNVLRAYNASDARLCDGLICIDANPNYKQVYNKRRYYQAKNRPRQ